MDKTKTGANCERCQYYRPQISFVDAWKRLDRSGPRKEIMESLKEVREGETEALENEVELLFELVRGELLEWPQTPRFAPYCNADDKVQVAALKNRGGRCADYTPARSRDERACYTCKFMTDSIREIGDRHEPLQGWMNEGLRNHVTNLNKERADADAAARGLEIEQSFYGDGKLPVVSFLPTCGAKRKDGQQFVPPFCNLRSDCPDHSARLSVPITLLPTEPEGVNDIALTWTLDLIRMVAESGEDDPAGFVDRAVRWIEEDSKRVAAAEWIHRGLARWSSIAKVDDALLEKLPKPGKGDRLFPFIAGVNAFEWGWVVSRSQTHALGMANASIQQLAEFMAATVRPLDGARCVDSAEQLLNAGLFSPDARAIMDSFLRRLRVRREDLLHTTRTDLVVYYESLAAELLYSVANWLRAKTDVHEGISTFLGDAFAKQYRDQLKGKVEEARHQGMNLLSRLSFLENPQAQPYPAEYLEQISQVNEKALDLDIQEQKHIFQLIMDRAMGMADPSGQSRQQDQLAKMFGFGQLSTSGAVDGAIDKFYAPVRASELPRRRLAAWLIMRRGTLPVTPSALEFKEDGRPAATPPESIERALLEPASKNVEAIFPPPGVDQLLALCRRMASPSIVPDLAR